MYDIMILTHGSMAVAMKETLGMFTRDADSVVAIGLGEEGVEAFRQAVVETASRFVDPKQELLVFVDLFGGTPYNVAMSQIKAQRPGTEIIAGVNLPMLLEATLMRGTNRLAEAVSSLVVSGRQSVMVKAEVRDSAEDE